MASLNLAQLLALGTAGYLGYRAYDYSQRARSLRIAAQAASQSSPRETPEERAARECVVYNARSNADRRDEEAREHGLLGAGVALVAALNWNRLDRPIIGGGT